MTAAGGEGFDSRKGGGWLHPFPLEQVSLVFTLPALFCFLTQMFGCGSVAQVVLSRGTHGGFLTINLAFGFAVTLGILIAGQVSGKALSPPSSNPTWCPTGNGVGAGVFFTGQGIAMPQLWALEREE